MPKFLYICTKSGNLDERSFIKLRGVLNKMLLPDNLIPAKPINILQNGEALLVFNPNENTRVKDVSLCQGYITDSQSEWHKVRGNVPEGTFSIIRTDADLTEVVTDPVGSYTVWYYFSDELFLVSSSQRAIIHYLKSFEFNEEVIPWMLSSGIIGPAFSWDRRIRMVHGHTSVFLEKKNWKLKEVNHEFVLTKVSHNEAEDFIRNSIFALFEKINLNFDRWILPLSGGGDSRLLLTLLHKKTGLRTITWGTRHAVDDKMSDAALARKVADFYKVPNHYFILNETDLEPSVVLRRLLVAGEGRTDTLVGYVDGFELWKGLYESNIQGVIRGDHGFCTRSPIRQTENGLHWSAFKLLSDYREFEELKKYVQTKQNFPENFNRMQGESLESWEIRLRQSFRFPYLMSALNDLKNSFVDVYNPLLSRSIIEAVLSCPSRADKTFFKRFNKEIGPGFPFASKDSTPSLSKVLGDKGFNGYIRDYLGSVNHQSILNPGLISFLLNGQSKPSSTGSTPDFRKWAKSHLKYFIPYSLKNKLVKEFTSYSINYNQLALRIFIILSMSETLQQDSKSG